MGYHEYFWVIVFIETADANGKNGRKTKIEGQQVSR